MTGDLEWTCLNLGSDSILEALNYSSDRIDAYNPYTQCLLTVSQHTSVWFANFKLLSTSGFLFKVYFAFLCGEINLEKEPQTTQEYETGSLS